MRSILLSIFATWVSGIVAGVAGSAGWWLIGAGIVVVVITIKNKQGWALVTALIALLVLGWGYGWTASHQVISGCDGIEGKMAEVESRPEYLEKQLRFVARVGDCRVLVSSSPWLTISQRDQVVISGGRRQSLEEVKDFSAGYADYLGRRGIGATWFFPDVEIIEVNNLRGWSAASKTQILSNVLRRCIQMLFVEPDASLVLGMLLAQKGTISEEITQQFQATSVSHILAISGMNVSIIAGIIYFVLSWLPMRKSWQTGLMLTVLWLYIVFIGSPVSVVRAGSFITVVVVLLRLSKLVSLPTALVATAVVYATVDPLVMLDVGWQLSVSAVLGIFLILFVTKQIQPRLNKGGIGLWLYNALIVSLGASLATWPLIMYHFGNVSLVSLLANMLVVPVVPLILVLAPASIALSWLWMGGGLLLSMVTHWSISWLLGVTEVLSRWPGMYWQEMTMPVWAMAIYFAAILGLAHYVLRWQNRSWREVWA